jgi:Bacterial Ig domain
MLLGLLLLLNTSASAVLSTAPIARNDFYTNNEDTVLSVAAPGVLVNDVYFGPILGTLSARLNTPPTNGTLVVNANGSFTYRPATNFNGTDAFTYTAFISQQSSTPAIVTITVKPVNDPPFGKDLFFIVPANSPGKPITLSGSDVDGDALSFRIESPPQHGILNGTPPNVTYVPTPGFAGDDLFVYTVSDGRLRSTNALVALDVQPILTFRTQFISVNEGSGGLFCLGGVGNPVAITVNLSARTPKTVQFRLGVLDTDACGNNNRATPDSFSCSSCVPDFTLSFGAADSSGNWESSIFSIPANSSSFTTPAFITTVPDCQCENDECFQVFFSGQPVNALLDPNGMPLIVDILNDDFCFGTAELIPAETSVRVGERLNYGLVWTHPQQWRKLETIDLRISDNQGIIFQLHWNEPTNSFNLTNPETGEAGPLFRPGDPNRLETPAATLYLGESAVIGSGPTGHSVLLDLSLGFKPQAAGRTYRVEAFATDDFGNHQVVPVGRLTVLP